MSVDGESMEQECQSLLPETQSRASQELSALGGATLSVNVSSIQKGEKETKRELRYGECQVVEFYRMRERDRERESRGVNARES
jgi:hypothetical protein